VRFRSVQPQASRAPWPIAPCRMRCPGSGGRAERLPFRRPIPDPTAKTASSKVPPAASGDQSPVV
jgi:hypothetical protein